MTRKFLESYKPNERLIKRNRQKIKDEKLKEIPAVKGKVRGSSPEFPYIEQGFSVEMDEPVEAEKQYRRIQRWKREISQAEQDNAEIEQFIHKISDPKAREIFQYRYIDAIKTQEVGRLVGYSKGRISQIIKKYLKD